jgi:hypothetical protein
MVGKRYLDVPIQFRTPGNTLIDVNATVFLRPEEMVIDIDSQPSSPQYLVIGKKVEYFFAGVDSLAHEVKVHVIARWALLGDVYVGIWIEEGREYLFMFRLPRGRVTKRAIRGTTTTAGLH